MFIKNRNNVLTRESFFDTVININSIYFTRSDEFEDFRN
jgi:hypothetical protein